MMTSIIAFERLSCSVCDIQYALTEKYVAKRREDGEAWRCPNGHSQRFIKSQVDCLKDDLDEMRRQRDSLRQNEAYMAETIEAGKRRAAAFKGQATKLRKRAQNGVCPCCNRSFSNLQRHMKTKHPDFTQEAPEGAEIVALRKQA